MASNAIHLTADWLLHTAHCYRWRSEQICRRELCEDKEAQAENEKALWMLAAARILRRRLVWNPRSVNQVRLVWLEDLQLARAHERLGAALHVELAVDIVDVALDRAERDDQPVGDRLIG
jgi:hypothetical protein